MSGNFKRFDFSAHKNMMSKFLTYLAGLITKGARDSNWTVESRKSSSQDLTRFRVSEIIRFGWSVLPRWNNSRMAGQLGLMFQRARRNSRVALTSSNSGFGVLRLVVGKIKLL